MRRAHSALLVVALFAAPGCLTEDGPALDNAERTGEPSELAVDDLADDLIEHGHKVRICHIPPGNPGNAHTIKVSQSAVPAHLAHGDYLGACNPSCDPTPQICPPGQTWDCYSAPLSTDGIGACHRGVKTCNATGTAWSACVGEVTPTTETCNGVDDDCDGTVDDGCPPICVPCPEVCGDGLDNDCDGTVDDGCPPICIPTAETCGDGVDNDCDGNVDEGCVCPPGEEWTCYTAPLSTDGIGACQRGIKTCNPDGMGYGPCVGEITPQPETCGNGVDDDCDGTVDDGCPPTCVPTAEVCGDGLDNDCDGNIDEGCVCAPGSAAPCYPGPSGTEGVGTCAAGVQICNPLGTGYGACVGAIVPVAEVCLDGADNDCDGVADDGCVCAPGSQALCYDGPAGTGDIGTCMPGTRTCNATGTGYGACVGSIVPVLDVCGDGLDNDCDGGVDEGCVCTPGTVAPCYDGPAGTEGVGTCHAGSQTCNGTGTNFGDCVGSVGPTAELCGDELDNDCDGIANDGCVCTPGTTAACYAGPPAAAGVGVCAMGSQACNGTGTAYDACVGSVLPGTEVCGDGLDNDCDGVVDEGCIGDRAWRDLNANGIQNGGEPGLAGVTFRLRFASSGAQVAVQVSDANGRYHFANVAPGTYVITCSPPGGGFSMVGPNMGGNDNLDSDFDDEDLVTAPFAFSATSSIDHIDAGFAGGPPV